MTPFEPSPEDADIEEILQRPEATIIIHSCHKTAAWIEPHTTSSPALSARREMWPSTGPQGSSQPPRATTPRARARPLPRPRARGALPRLFLAAAADVPSALATAVRSGARASIAI
eukprot:CAMPEP_0184735880 /NCGR_PEP_ID=MMETSP0314-20130426/62120_1 /TAXON_ID=38298 /ORGANISM="Rhodella maculata, Strain CCMP 736" /LENGTH=115 /DNA_ID=CAMNT_0027202933 /DNA_START=206 /DNA_END=554 /DNA_ORIENTATION=-